MLTIMETAVTRLRALKPPAAYRAQAQKMIADFAAALATARLAMTAAQHREIDKARALVERTMKLAEQANALAFALGAARCGSS
jgi:hypothetical protein